MNYKNFLLSIIGSIIGLGSVQAGQLELVKQVLSPDAVCRPEKSDQLTVISRQLETLEKTDKQAHDQVISYEVAQEKISKELAQIKTSLKTASGETLNFLNKKLPWVSRTYQNISEIVQELRQMIAMIEDYSVELKNYLDDPQCRSLLVPRKASFDFDDLKKSAQALFSAKTRLDDLENLKKTLEIDHEKRKKALDAVAKEYDEKNQQQQEFAQGVVTVDESMASFSRKHQGELLDEQLRQADYKRQFVQLKVDEDKMRLELMDMSLIIKRRQVEVLEQEYAMVKRAVVIDPAYVKSVEENLEKSRQELFDKREKINDNIRFLLPLKEQFKKHFERVVRRFDVAANDVTAIKDWSKEPENIKTVNEWLALGILGATNAHELLVETQLELYEAQIRQANIEFHHQELEVEILRSWYRMTHHRTRYNVDAEIEQEKKKYATERSQLRVDLAELSEKRDAVINLLYRLNVTHDKIKAFVVALNKQQSTLFASQDKNFQETQDGFIRADEEVRKRINLIGRLMEAYAKSIARIRGDIKDIDEVMVELGAKSFWMRSDQSIEWRDLQNFIPDLKRFLRDFRNTGFAYLKDFSIGQVFDSFVRYVQMPYFVILLLLRLLIVVIIYILLRIYIPDIHNYLLQGESRYRLIARLRALFVVFFDFVQVHLTSLYIWFLLFMAVTADWVDHYAATWFYLLSIPYLLWISYGFFSYFVTVNKSRGYLFMSQSYQWRFMTVVSTLVYATICISFFRQAFMVGNYYDSQMPDILLAMNFILLQIALICLIGKEQILSMFASGTPAAQWMEERVEKYYYGVLLFVIAVIVMSNPYVGYGRQVFYVLSRVVATAFLVPIFSWMHNRIKRSSSDFFFYYTDGSAVKERFPAGKAWYGAFIVVWFAIFVVLGIVLGARLWGVHIGLIDVKHWFSHTIYSPGLDEVTGKPVLVTGMSLFRIVMYVLGGFGIAYIINRYVLQRIFDPLLIGSGVQSTILTITRYIVVVIAFLVGLHSAGLEGMAMKLVVLAGILSFAVKEPLADFFAYFVILVQRPVKIGDLIQVDPDIIGIVRHITPRSIILRNRNSVTLIIPNSMLITRMVRNWSYVRTFSAVNDIEITLPFNIDIDKAKQIMLDVVENHPAILKNPTPIVWLTEFAEHGYKFIIRGFISADKVTERFEIESQIRFELVRRLRQEGIHIAVPIRFVRQINGDDTIMPK